MPTTQTPRIDPATLIDEAPALGSPPVVYRRLMEVIDDPRASANAVAAVISQDPALTARLLALVNSSFFGFGRRIDTVGQAVGMVGMSQVRDLALATSVTSVFRDIPPDLIHQEDFWKHSLACGIGARVLAAARRETNVERFFVAGMLHDLGRLVLYLRAPDVARAILERALAEGVPLHRAEREVVACDHALIGAALMRRWSMPESLVEAVEYHHAPERAEQHPLEASTVHVADTLAHELELGRSGECRTPVRSEEALHRLGLTEEGLAEVKEEILEQYRDSVGVFGLDTDG